MADLATESDEDEFDEDEFDDEWTDDDARARWERAWIWTEPGGEA